MNALTVSLFYLLATAFGEQLQFTEDVYFTSVNETTVDTLRPTASILNVSCVHLFDSNTSNIAYRLLGNNTTFTLNNRTGELMVAVDLDYEMIVSYQLVLQCYDMLNSSCFDEAMINISVLPINEYRPTVNAATEVVLLVEGMWPIGTVIISTLPGGLFTYSASDEDDGPDGNIYYSVMLPNATNNQTFEFNSSVGALYLAQDFDLDANREDFKDERVQITVCDSSPPTPDCLNIDITIILILGNDNAPHFVSSYEEVGYSEIVNVGTTIVQVECIDDDYFIGELAGYRILSVYPPQTPEDMFRISGTGIISLNMPLNFEFTDTYELNVTCFDNGPQVMSDFSIVVVNVSAANDNAPKFQNSTISVTYQESVELYTLIATVHCSDEDIIIGEFFGYEIVSITPPLTPIGTFSINSTGAIETQLPLDFEFTNVYRLQVRCFDTGSPVMEDFANVTVNLEPVNDNRPHFISSLVNVSYPESLNVCSIVAQVECLDNDVSIGVLAGYELILVKPEQTPPNTFIINSEGSIILTTSLDFEFTDIYELRVRCFDSGSPVMTDVANVTVNLEPINDNKPQFISSLVNVSYPESLNVNSVVARVQCVDNDISTGALAGYELTSVSPPQTLPSTFIINSEGMIILNSSLDFEFTDIYELRVRCFDSGSPVMSDIATVRVNVSDINDNTPECSSVPDQRLSPKTYSQETLVILNCTDADSNENKELRYSFSQVPILTSGEFLLNSVTGEITLLGTIRGNKNYTIQVLIQDLGTPPKSTRQSFRVTIEGMEPSPPVIHLSLWAIIVVVVVGLLFICCVLFFFMCCCYCSFKQKKGKKNFTGEYASEEVMEIGADLIFAQYPIDRESPEPDSENNQNNYKDYSLRFKMTSFINDTASTNTPTSVSSDNDGDDNDDGDEGIVFTTSIEFVLNPTATETETEVFPQDDQTASIDSPPKEKSSSQERISSSSSEGSLSSERNSSPPEVMLMFENADIGLRTPGMDHSKDFLISTEDNSDKESNGM